MREHALEAVEEVEPVVAPGGEPAPAPALASVGAIGNQAFGAVVARNGKGGTATQTQTPGKFISRGMQATTAYQAHSLLLALHMDAYEMNKAGFTEFDILREEAASWMNGLGSSPTRMLTQSEAEDLNEYAQEFESKYRPAVEQLAQRLSSQLVTFQKPPISEEDLFEIRESVHEQFVNDADEDVLGDTVKLLGKAEELIEEVTKWTDYAAKAKDKIAAAKKISEIHEGIKGVQDKIGEAKKVVELVRDIGVLSGAVGKTPAGTDPVAQFESALNLVDWGISKFEVPGFKQLWDGYIFKAAKLCLQKLQELKKILYKGDRQGAIRFFFDQYRNADKAPDIRKSFHHGDPGPHFPGGQPMLDFMWQLMKSPDSITKVPRKVEEYFLEWRDQFNAGMSYKLESDSSIGNLWNVFTDEEAPNVVQWAKTNRKDIWIKLYGGNPAPG